MSNGDTQNVVPGQTQGTTPPMFQGNPTLPGSPASSGGTDEQVRRMLDMIRRSMEQRKMNAHPHPGSVPGQIDPSGSRSIGMNTSNPHAWGAQRFMAGMSDMVRNAASKYKESQITKAEGDWEYLQSSLNEFYAAQSSGDPKATEAAQRKLDFATDPKKLKLMAKALNQDWLNPDKTTVHGEALKRVIAKTQKTDTEKQNAKQGLMGIFKQLMQRAQKKDVQYTPDEQNKLTSEIVGRAPTGIGDPKQQSEDARTIAELTNAQANITRAQTEAREKYKFQVTADGKIVALDPTNPSGSIMVTDEKGNQITGAPKGVQKGPQAALVNGVPIGVTKSVNGKIQTVLPGDAEWTGEDAKIFQAATGATAASNASKDHRVKVSAESRAQSFAKTREYAVIDSRTGQEQMVSADIINAAPKGTYAPASGGAKIMNQEAIFKEIDYTSGQLKASIEEMGDTGFDAEARAQIAAVLRDTDPKTAWNQFLTSEVAGTLTDPQIRYVTSLVSMDESAMSLRSIAGQGQSSDSMRSRISAMLPSAGTPSAKYARQQMKLFDGELVQLKKGVPGLGTGGAKKTDTDQDPLGILK